MERKVAFEQRDEFKDSVHDYFQNELIKARSNLELARESESEAFEQLLLNWEDQESITDYSIARREFDERLEDVSLASKQFHCNHLWNFWVVTLRCYEGKCAICSAKIRFGWPFSGRIHIPPSSIAQAS